VSLSPGRTRHLFVQQTGLSFRTYLLWLRLDRAVALFAEGASLTAAANAAGFADSATFSMKSVNAVQTLLSGTVRELGEAGQNHRFGFGRMDVLRALGFAHQ